MLLHGLAEFAGVEKQQAQNTLENVYGCTGWKDAHNKEKLFYISQTPVSSFVNPFFVHRLETVLK